MLILLAVVIFFLWKTCDAAESASSYAASAESNAKNASSYAHAAKVALEKIERGFQPVKWKEECEHCTGEGVVERVEDPPFLQALKDAIREARKGKK